MKTQHTPGPWKYHRLDGITGLIAEDGTVLARINTPCNNERTGKANAALIASAPELLDALERIIVDLIGYLPNNNLIPHIESITKARAAIQKARGEQ